MPKFVAKMKFPYLDKKKITNALFAKVKKVVVLALLDFLKVALTRVPVDTGMAQGTFIPLMLAIQRSARQSVEIPTQPIRNEDPYMTVGRRRILRTVKGGAETGRPVLIDDIIEQLVTQININYGTVLRYFNLLEFQGGKGHRPWNAYREGAKAFRRYLKEHLLDEVEGLKNFFGTTEINVKGNNVSVTVDKGKTQVRGAR